MTNGLTDKKASVPEWARRLIIWLFGQPVMDALDRIGRKHDRRLRHGMTRWIANRKMVADMVRDPIIHWFIILTFWPLLQLYAAIPSRLKKLYWKAA